MRVVQQNVHLVAIEAVFVEKLIRLLVIQYLLTARVPCATQHLLLAILA